MYLLLVISLALCLITNDSNGYKSYGKHDNGDYLADSFLQTMADAMGKDYGRGYLPSDNQFDFMDIEGKTSSQNEIPDLNYVDMIDENNNMVPSIRDIEYLQNNNNLWGPKTVSGGAEDKQRLKPVETVHNKNQVKTDAILPAYCNPPNPCPVGYTAKDGCLEEFENTAAFSRKYQAAQRCMCDAEHMYDCPSHRSPHKTTTYIDKRLSGFENKNPYLEGVQLPIAAKKGINIGF